MWAGEEIPTLEPLVAPGAWEWPGNHVLLQLAGQRACQVGRQRRVLVNLLYFQHHELLVCAERDRHCFIWWEKVKEKNNIFNLINKMENMDNG